MHRCRSRSLVSVQVVLMLALSCASRREAGEAPVSYVGWEQLRTMQIIRDLAIAIEEYAIEHDHYPASPGWLVGTDDLDDRLSPAFLDEVPRSDAWGAPLIFYSDGTEYMIISPGSDGEPDLPYETLAGRPFEEISETVCGLRTYDDRRDIVFLGGQFCQWPGGVPEG